MTRALLLASLLLAMPALHAQSWQDDPGDDEQSAWLEQQAATTNAYHARISAALASSRDVREQAFSALLHRLATAPESPMPGSDAPSRPVPRDAAADDRLRALAAKAGDDRLANQLLIIAAGDPASPVRAEAARRWQSTDPGNVSPLLYAGLPADALLVEARRATHVETHGYDVVRWLMSVYLRYPLTTAERAALSGGDPYHDDEAAAISAASIWGAATPAYSGLVEACRGAALRAVPTRAADCRHLATLLAERSGSAIDRAVGLAMLRELAGNNTERAAIDARRRTMDWQMLQWGRIAQQQPRDGAEQFVRLLGDASITTEQQLVERVLQEAGVPLEPPAGWSPPRY